MSHHGFQADMASGGSGGSTKPKEKGRAFVWRPEEQVRIERRGKVEDPDFSVHYFDKHAGDAPISPWHSIPLALTSLSKAPFLYGIIEIPRGTRSKFEISTTTAMNPIVRDVDKHGKPRSLNYVHPDFPDGIPFHYGALPQTWESRRHHSFKRSSNSNASADHDFLHGHAPGGSDNVTGSAGSTGLLSKLNLNKLNPFKSGSEPRDARAADSADTAWNDGCDTVRTLCDGSVICDHGLPGDNDPLDVVNLSATPREVGDVVQLRVLGALPMIDGGEVDWKIITCEADDPSFKPVRTIYHVAPETLATVLSWFRDYKTVDGKGTQQFANSGDFLSLAPALRVIDAMHTHWDGLRRGCEAWATDAHTVSDCGKAHTHDGHACLMIKGVRDGVCAAHANDKDNIWSQKNWYWETGKKGWGAA